MERRETSRRIDFTSYWWGLPKMKKVSPQAPGVKLSDATTLCRAIGQKHPRSPFPVTEMALSLLCRGAVCDIQLKLWRVLLEPTDSWRPTIIYGRGTDPHLGWAYSSEAQSVVRRHHWLPDPGELLFDWPLQYALGPRTKGREYTRWYIEDGVGGEPVGPRAFRYSLWTGRRIVFYDHTPYFKDLLALLLETAYIAGSLGVAEERRYNLAISKYASPIIKGLPPSTVSGYFDILYLLYDTKPTVSPVLNYDALGCMLANEDWWYHYTCAVGKMGLACADMDSVGLERMLRVCGAAGEVRAVNYFNATSRPRDYAALTRAALVSSAGPFLAGLRSPREWSWGARNPNYDLTELLCCAMHWKCGGGRGGAGSCEKRRASLRAWVQSLDGAALRTCTENLVGCPGGSQELLPPAVSPDSIYAFATIVDLAGDLRIGHVGRATYMCFCITYGGSSKIALSHRASTNALENKGLCSHAVSVACTSGLDEGTALERLGAILSFDPETDVVARMEDFSELRYAQDRDKRDWATGVLLQSYMEHHAPV